MTETSGALQGCVDIFNGCRPTSLTLCTIRRQNIQWIPCSSTKKASELNHDPRSLWVAFHTSCLSSDAFLVLEQGMHWIFWQRMAHRVCNVGCSIAKSTRCLLTTPQTVHTYNFSSFLGPLGTNCQQSPLRFCAIDCSTTCKLKPTKGHQDVSKRIKHYQKHCAYQNISKLNA